MAEDGVVTRTGDIWCIDAHRLACGDAGDPELVNALMAGDKAALCFTSPPYLYKRDYENAMHHDWDGMMREVFANLPMRDDGQVLVNLGMAHKDGDVITYWEPFVECMKTQGWRRFGWYVWDQGPGLPGDWNGRLAPCFEFIFHFNRAAIKPNKTIQCSAAGKLSHPVNDMPSGLRAKNGTRNKWTNTGKPIQTHKIPDAVIRISRNRVRIGDGIDHPAVFPIALPKFIIEAYSRAGDIVYEPFSGSGTTIMAAQRTRRCARAVEIVPHYVDVAITRYRRSHPGAKITLAGDGRTFGTVASERVKVDYALEQYAMQG